jgi:hypothetical protein
MSDYRSEASSRSAVKTELTSAHLECLLGPGLAMRDVVRRLVGHSAWQLVMATSAGDPQMTHALMVALQLSVR